MPAASYIGSNTFRTWSIEEVEDSEGVDGLLVTLRGRTSDLAATSATWTRGKSAASLGYPNMYLQVKRSSQGAGSNYADLTLEFAGFLSSTYSNPISIEDDITLQAGTFVSDELDSDGRAQNVQASYMAQSTTTRWIYRGNGAPLNPQYRAKVPSRVPTNTLFDHYPASYTGTLQTKMVGRLAQFSRVELAPGVWAVSEQWVSRIEPDTD